MSISKNFKKKSAGSKARRSRKAGTGRFSYSVAPLVRAQGVEHKFYDSYVESDVVVSTNDATGAVIDPVLTIISGVPQGVEAHQRDGKYIVIDTVIINGVVSIPFRTADATANASIPFPKVFIALVQDTQTNEVVMKSEDCFVNRSATTVLCASPMKNLLHATRFITLKIWDIDIPPTPSVSNFALNTISTPGINKAFSCFLKVNIPVNFNGTGAGNNAAVVDNSLHMVAWTNETNSFVNLSYHARVRFFG